MSVDITLFTGPIYVELPQGWIGWLGWLSLLVIVVSLLVKWWGYQKKWNNADWGIFFGLLLLAPLASLLLVLRLPAGEALPPPGKPIDPGGPALVVFGSLPWVLAALLLGPAPAAFLGALSGMLLALGDSHSLFTPLETALFAVVLSACLHQRYRTRFYRALRRPLFAVFALALSYPLLFLMNTLFVTWGLLASRLDYALTHVLLASLASGGQLVIAGVFTEVVALSLPDKWKNTGPWIPSPSERRLETRFLYNMAPLSLLLLIALIVGDWVVAGNAAEIMLKERMASTAQVASETVPFFLETGQNLIQQIAKNPRLFTEPPGRLPEVLAQELRAVPFFRQLYLLDAKGDSIGGYPLPSYERSYPPQEELAGLKLALNGVMIQNYTIPPVEGEQAAQVSFLATIADEFGEVQGVLIGRSDLASNPFTQPVLSSIRNMVGSDGEGMLLDGSGRILFHPSSVNIMENYTGRMAEELLFYYDTAPDGTRRMVYYQPVAGHPWSVVLSVPASRAQQMALNIAGPLLGMLLALFFAAMVLLRLGLRMVTSSLQNLGAEANRISQGQLDHTLAVEGEDEVGQLRRSFEQMRVSLKARMDELNCLLLVSQGVASSLEMEEAVQPVLESALLTSGAPSARVVLAPSNVLGMEADASGPSRFGMGSSSDIYTYLDEQVLALARQQDQVVLKNISRARVLNIAPGYPRPDALLALALRHESHFYGVLWLGYDRPHQFTEDEVRFMATLAGQAALAAANAGLFQSAEIGRQTLAAILASTPDPVLVTDHQNRLLLSNPAAWQALGLGPEAGSGQPIQQVTSHSGLVKLLSSTSEENQSAEVVLPDGRIFLATASTVQAEGRRVGRVCLMRDITHFKELDALKSEFVATVSHDLRSPLTLLRGYTTMLEMVGDLNDQQTGYVRKMVTSVESMSRLVNNLLDLGRIEAGVDLMLEMVMVHDVVERVVNSLQLTANQKRIQLEVEIPTQTTPLIEADQALLQQALHNLVENAIKYTAAGGKVAICVSARQNGIAFEVSDTGMGIAPVDQLHLFERFFRVGQRDAKSQPGTGLGLAIVKSIAERHGGKVWLESQLGKGSTFYFLIPLRQPKRETKITRDQNQQH